MSITTKTLKTLTYTTGFLAMLSIGFFGASAVLADTTYLYVTTSGEVKTVQADNADEAMMNATDRDPNSGVMAATQYEDPVPTTTNTTASDEDEYLYVDEDGNIAAEDAATPMEAITEADDIMDNSGVIAADEYEDLADDATVAVTTFAGGNTYAFVTMTDEIDYVSAMSWEAALTNAVNIKYNSGVMLVTE
jgi:hypothetical protein